MNPIISIIIPCYNHGKYIEETLASIEKAKDRYPIEIIIVNDGSIDEYTISVLKKIEEKGYFVLNQNNGGLGNARNNGIKLAKGKYILPLDSDNNVLSPYFNDAVDILEKNADIDIVYGNIKKIGEITEDSFIEDFNLQKLMIGNVLGKYFTDSGPEDKITNYNNVDFEDFKANNENNMRKMPKTSIKPIDNYNFKKQTLKDLLSN